ncbi:hypothetical protein C8J57DRAFT_1480281 [Mycena rebaudengoi]|nr:hypothetical protein C8J57DRAFT_1480281 [Mycena rebaudengoi]
MLVVKAIVQDLPVEVLSRVLRIALEFLVAGWPLYAGELTVLQGVCRHWNDVLSADSAVWCRIYIDPWTPLHRVEKWLQRSKGPSLFVYINITVGWPAPSSTYSPSVFVDAVLNVVGRSFCRIPRLRPSVSGFGVPYLQHCLFPSKGGYGFCRNLAELRLQDMWDPIDVRQSELYAVLRSVPRLARLHLLFVDCIDFSDVAVDPLVLSHLIHLEFAPVSMGSCPLLGRVVMPILQTLVLAFEPLRLIAEDRGVELPRVFSKSGSGVYGWFPLLSLVVADSCTRNSGSELAKLLLGGGVFMSSFDVVLRIGGLDGGTFVKYCLEGSRSKPLL